MTNQKIEDVTALRATLWANGFRPVPIYNHDHTGPSPGKRPLGQGWREDALHDPPLCAVSPAVAHALNSGILTDGLRAIDIDVDDVSLVQAIDSAVSISFGWLPRRWRDNSPRALYLARAAEGTPRKRVVSGPKGKVEILGAGQQFVAYGMHPSGSELHWTGPMHPRRIKVDDLKAVTEDQITVFLAQCAVILGAEAPPKGALDAASETASEAPPRANGHAPVNGHAPRVKRRQGAASEATDGEDHISGADPYADPIRLAEALSAIPNDGPPEWEAWNRVGMAVWRATGGSNAGGVAWDAWSRRNPAYSRAETLERWRHYADSPPDDLGAGTIFFLASKAREAQPSRPPTEAPGRPVIRVFSGLRHIAADQGLSALHAAGTAFYQRDRILVRTATMKAKTSDGTIIEIANIVPVTVPIIGRALGMAAEWGKTKADGEVVRIDPPKDVVEQISAMTGEWPFPPLTGIISTPTMRPDGSILARPGYDEQTGFVLIAPPPMPVIPEILGKIDADRAIELLQSLLNEFQFCDDVSRGVALSMILTTVLRGALLPAVPMHLAIAPAPGTGKSYLADIASAISTGERCAVIAVAPNPEETEKRLIGAALAGYQIISLDNVSEMLSGDFLNQVSERPILQLRGLGASTILRVPNMFTVFANGNNIGAPADLSRRTIICRLDANMENPEEREFQANPVADILADRGKYIAACLTIGRAYIQAGRPVMCRPLPSFERWSGLVRSALMWLGVPDPCESMNSAREEDPVRAARAAVFTAWRDEIGLFKNGIGNTAAQLVDETEVRDEHGFLRPRFREACINVAGDRSDAAVNPRRLGKWLASNVNNKSGDLKLTVNRRDPSSVRWILSRS